MTDTTPATPVPEWNPLAPRNTVTIELAASGGRASVTYRPWTGRERLAFEDALTERMMTPDPNGGEGTVKIGTLRLIAASLTIVGSVGFPPAPDGRVFLTGSRDQVEDDLLAITDTATFDEIRATATKVQPLPREDAGDDAKDSDAADPSRTPRTDPTPTAGVELTGSPVGS